MVTRDEIFIDFSKKRGVRKLQQSFFLVEVGLPNLNQSDSFVGRFDNLCLGFSGVALSSKQKLENLVLRLKLSLLMS